MIQGLQIDVPAAELKTMLEGRLKYHQDKLAAYRKQHESLSALEDDADRERAFIGKISNSSRPLDSIESSISHHESQVIYYKFMAEHVVPSEVYRLNESDLQRLGISSRAYG